MFEELKKQVGGLADAWAVERGFAIANEQRRKLSARIDAIEARVAKLEVDGRVAKRMVVGRMQHTQSDRAAWDAIEAEERASATAATKSG